MNLSQSHINSLRQLCALHNVDTMYLFGSAVGKNFGEDSDFDFLVKFKTIDLASYFDNYIQFKEKLKQLLGRDVDLLEEQAIKNPILIHSINKNKELIYG